MKKNNFLTATMLVGLTGLIAGCHELARDDYWYGSGYGSYSDGFRDGRAYERRRENWRDSGYYNNDYYYGRRW
jgi:hypothetical protein